MYYGNNSPDIFPNSNLMYYVNNSPDIFPQLKSNVLR